ncbi:MAG: hypothetical protein RLZZ584_4275, partial [Pseudomonadota bacterium]
MQHPATGRRSPAFFARPDHMSDESQIHVPDSYTALHTNERHRLTLPLPELRQRYELCEDLAQQLVEQGQRLHHDLGLAQEDVLSRCLAGLQGEGSGLGPA